MGDGTPFVIMERLAGITLEEAASRGPLPTAEIWPILRGIASALSAAHAAGIAHGQVRADNIFIAQAGRDERPCPKLLDFGVARLATGGRGIGPGGTDVDSARPELDLGGRAGERADQLALARLAHRLIGRVATPTVEEVLFRATSADPSRRFGTIMAFIEALENAFVNASTGVSPKNASEMTIPMGAIPGSARRPVSFATSLRVAAHGPSNSAPATAPASTPSSLTQQFFAEGDQLDSAHAASHADPAETNVEEEDDGDLGTRAVRVPRSRPQMIVAAALALGSVALIAGTVVALANKPAGGSPTAQISPLAGVVRPDALSAALVHSPAPARERERETAVLVNRRARRPSAPAKAAVTPAGSPGPAAVELGAPPPPPALAAEAATAATDRRPPEEPPAAPSNEGAAQPANEATTVPVQEPPKPSDREESEPAVPSPETESPPSVPEPPPPAAAMERV
jgi:serine/threonine-protein kinase